MDLTIDDDGKQVSMTDKMLALVKAVELEGGYEGASLRAKAELGEGERGSEDLQLLQLVSNVAKHISRDISGSVLRVCWPAKIAHISAVLTHNLRNAIA